MVRELLAVTVAQDLMLPRFVVKPQGQHVMQVEAVVAVRQAVLVVLVVAVIVLLLEPQTRAVVAVPTTQRVVTTALLAVRE
jgi:hypothetical protein